VECRRWRSGLGKGYSLKKDGGAAEVTTTVSTERINMICLPSDEPCLPLKQGLGQVFRSCCVRGRRSLNGIAPAHVANPSRDCFLILAAVHETNLTLPRHLGLGKRIEGLAGHFSTVCPILDGHDWSNCIPCVCEFGCFTSRLCGLLAKRWASVVWNHAWRGQRLWQSTLRRAILRYGLDEFCSELTHRGAPLRLRDEDPVTGRFFARLALSRALQRRCLRSVFGIGYAGPLISAHWFRSVWRHPIQPGLLMDGSTMYATFARARLLRRVSTRGWLSARASTEPMLFVGSRTPSRSRSWTSNWLGALRLCAMRMELWTSELV